MSEDASLQLLKIERDQRIRDAIMFISRLNRGELQDFKEKEPRLSAFIVEELTKDT